MYKQVDPWYKRKAQISSENGLTLTSNTPFYNKVSLLLAFIAARNPHTLPFPTTDNPGR